MVDSPQAQPVEPCAVPSGDPAVSQNTDASKTKTIKKAKTIMLAIGAVSLALLVLTAILCATNIVGALALILLMAISVAGFVASLVVLWLLNHMSNAGKAQPNNEIRSKTDGK